MLWLTNHSVCDEHKNPTALSSGQPPANYKVGHATKPLQAISVWLL